MRLEEPIVPDWVWLKDLEHIGGAHGLCCREPIRLYIIIMGPADIRYCLGSGGWVVWLAVAGHFDCRADG
eukprot:2485549-Prorocentrum_lima.AAC.1